MIEAQVVRSVQEHDLETGDVISKLGIRLPTGDIIYAEASAQVMQKLRHYDATTPLLSHLPRKAEPPPQHVAAVQPPQQEDLPEDYEPAPEVDEYGAGDTEGYDGEDQVEWMKLPDNLLPEHVKKAMSEIRVGQNPLPEVLQLAQVVQIRDSILDEYSADDWERLGFVAEPHVQKPGSVQWADGGTQQPRMVPQRRVSRVDERGNPIVRANPNDVDPGEIAAADDDDTEQF